MIFDFATLPPRDRYKLLIGIVVPRPIALVTSIDADGRVNAAPFSFFNVFGEDPAQVVLGIQRRPGGEKKDTGRNLSAGRGFVVNMVDEALAETMNQTAIDFPPDVSEVEVLGLATEASVKVPAPRLRDAPFALECRMQVTLSFAPERELLIGEVLLIHARDGLTDPATLHTDTGRYRPVGRLAGNNYARQGEVFELKRPTYKDWLATRPEPPIE